MEERGLVLKMMRLTRSKTSDHQVYTNETFSLPAVLFNYIYTVMVLKMHEQF